MDGVTIVLPKPTPSGNKTKRSHWATTRARRDEWGWLLTQAGAKRAVAEGKFYREVVITRFGANLLDEHDNLPWGAKELVDELKAFGLIEDDAPAKCTVVVLQTKEPVKANRRTVICLKDLR